jgi:cytochrome c-type biogenesis protein CcsB
MTMNTLTLKTDPPVPRGHRTESGLHAAVYLIGAAILVMGPIELSGWDLAVLAIAAAATSLLALRALAHSRGLLAAMAAALGAIALQRAGPELLARTLASSQAWILAMAVCAVAATIVYAASAVARSGAAWTAAHRMSWAAFVAGIAGLLVRWWESYQPGGGFMGHVPISNLYEVFVLFVLIALALQLRIQRDPGLRPLGGLLSLAASAAAAFLVWYATEHRAHELQPLVPALDSYWMKLHVPANFIGYGAFCLSALVSAAWLLAGHAPLARRLPSRALLDELSYRLVAVGFVAFTIATILGSLWAAEAWGGYWSWDPKETWALIVWLNYASWLHQRMVGGRRGALGAWWSLVGLLITLFAFLGVNIYLSGLHSYGGL